MINKPMGNKPLTKKSFESLLTKAAQPLPWKKSGPKGKGTSDSHSDDDYSGKYKSPDKIEGKEG